MLQLILHGIGDYFLQTDNQALNKKKCSWACFKHCFTYSLPFLLIGTPLQVLFIFLTHFIIDRTNLVAWLNAYKNGIRTIDNFGFSPERPFVITFWLYVIMDNLLHIICNYSILTYL